MAGAIAVEARRQPLGREHLQQSAKRHRRALFFDQKCRVDRAGRVIHGDDQVELRLARKPERARAVLMQHHAFARLALALSPMRAAPLGALDQARCAEVSRCVERLGGGPAIDGGGGRVASYVGAAVSALIGTAMSRTGWTGLLDPRFGKASPKRIAARTHAQSLSEHVSGLEREAFSRSPSARPQFPLGLYVGEDAIASCGPVATLPGSSAPHPGGRQNRTTCVLNSCAYDSAMPSLRKRSWSSDQ
jgi:hypothetical protein